MNNYFLKNYFSSQTDKHAVAQNILRVSSVAMSSQQATSSKLLCLGIGLKRGSTLCTSTFQNCLSIRLPSDPTLVRTQCLGNVPTTVFAGLAVTDAMADLCGWSYTENLSLVSLSLTASLCLKFHYSLA